MLITKTLLGNKLQTNHYLNRPHEIQKFTTLNELFEIQPDVKPTGAENPWVQYWAIGDMGHRPNSDADGIVYFEPVKHGPLDFACFNHIPFVLRLVDDDLPADLRDKYALRKKVKIKENFYFAYYLKRLDLSKVKSREYQTTVKDGVKETTDYYPTINNLRPTHPEIEPNYVETMTGDFVSTSSEVLLQFTKFDVEELVNVAKILYGKKERAIISEIAFCSGVDFRVQVDGSGGTTIYQKEAIGVQVCAHVTDYYSVGYTNEGFDIRIEFGATEPLIGGVLDAPVPFMSLAKMNEG